MSEFDRLCERIDAQYATGQRDELLVTVTRLAMLRSKGNKDAAQDTAVKVLEGIARYRSAAPFSHWVNKIISNTCADAGRHEAKDNVLNFRDDPTRQPDADIDDNSWQSDDYEFPDLSRITDPLIRCVIELMDPSGGGYTIVEIAESLDMKPNTLYSRVSRYRKASKLAILKKCGA